MTEPPADLPQVIQAELPPALQAGAYADFAMIWHTATSFVIDFVALKEPPTQVIQDDGSVAVAATTVVTSRVRIPPDQVFELCKGLTSQLDQWEIQTGRRSPGQDMPGIE